MKRPNQKGRKNERGDNGKIQESRKWENGDFYVIVNLHLWKLLENEDEE